MVSSLLRAKVIDSMLYVLQQFPFASLAHQQCIMILNSFKETFTPDDVKKLKEFILVELEGQSKFTFPSGRKTSGVNMGQITQIAFELRNLTQQQLDDEDSDEEQDEGADEAELAQKR